MSGYKFSWLHLSDLHRGQSADGLWLNHKARILDDIGSRYADERRPDCIFFTGDLVQGSASTGEMVDQYGLVDETLAEVMDAIGHKVPVIPVPGNHDLKRPLAHAIPTGLAKYFDDATSWAARKEVIDQESGPIIDTLREYFRPYLDWLAASIVPGWDEVGWPYQYGRLPGDVRLRIQLEDFAVGIVGVNSAFLDHSDGVRRGDIAVEATQLGAEIDTWCAGCDATMLLMHHPPDWVHSKLKFGSDVYPSDRFSAVLFGHIHEPTLNADDGAFGIRRYLPAPSLSGVEDYLCDTEDRVLGYSYGTLARSQESSDLGTLKVWVRRLSTLSDDRTITNQPGCNPREFKDVPMARPVSQRAIPTSSHYAPRLNDALGQLFEEGDALRKTGQHQSARVRFLSIADSASNGGTTVHLQAREAHARLLAAFCLYESGSPETARQELLAIDANLLEPAYTVELAGALAQLGSQDVARELVADSEPQIAMAVCQLADIADGEVPEEPVSAAVRIAASRRLLASGELERALDWALHSSDESQDPAVVANAVQIILSAAEQAEFRMDAVELPEPLLSRAAHRLGELVLAPEPALLLLVGGGEATRWRARLAILSCDFAAMDSAMAHLREMGSPDTDFGGYVRTSGHTEDDGDGDWREPKWQTPLREALQLSDEHARPVLLELARIHPRGHVLVAVARNLMRLGEFEGAISFATRAFDVWPGTGQRLLLAECELYGLRFEAASAHASHESLESRSEAMRLRALASTAVAGSESEAIGWWEQYLEQEPTDLQARVYLAQQFFSAGRLEEARNEIVHVLDQIRTERVVSPELLTRLSDLVGGTTKNLERRSSDLMRIAKLAYDLSGTLPAMARLYVLLRQRLGSPTELPPPDFDRLANISVLQAVSVEDIARHVTSIQQFQQAVASGYAQGAIPFESLVDDTDVCVAELVEDAMSLRWRFTAPPATGSAAQSLSGAKVLTGHLELHLLHRLNKLDDFLSAIGSGGALVIFRDVLRQIQEQPVLIHRRLEHSELLRLRSILILVDAQPLPIGNGSSETLSHKMVGVGSSGMSLEDFISIMAHAGVLPPSMTVGKPSIVTTSTAADHFTLDYDSLIQLDQAQVLRLVTQSASVHVGAADEAAARLRLRVRELSVVAEAFSRAQELVEIVGRLRSSGVLLVVDRPHVGVPAGTTPRAQTYAAWVEKAMSWIEALVRDESLLFLSADLLAAGMMAGSTPLDLARRVDWRTFGGRFEDMLTSRHAARERILTFGATLKGLGQHHSTQDEQLLALGFSDFVNAEGLLDVARTWGGLEAEEPTRLLESMEASSRVAAHAYQFPISCAYLYCETVWRAWDEMDDSLARAITCTLLSRLEGLPDGLGLSPVELGLRFLLNRSSVRPLASSRPVGDDSVTFTSESSAGRMWSCVSTWLETEGSRRRFRRPFRDAIVADVLEHSGQSQIIAAGPLCVAAVEVDGDSADFLFPLGSALEALAIVSGAWDARPLEMNEYEMTPRPETDPKRVVTMSAEQILVAGARALTKPGCKDTGNAWQVNVLVDGTPIPMTLPREALLLRAESPVRSELAAKMAHMYRCEDGRLSRLLRRLSEQPEDASVLREYAEHAIQSPWRRVRADPEDILDWGGIDGSFPRNIVELKELLSEPTVLAHDQMFDEVMSRAEGTWEGQPALFRRSVRIPGELSRALFESKLEQGPTKLVTGVGAAFQRLANPDQHPLGSLLDDLHVTVFVAQLDGLERAPLRSCVSSLLQALEKGPSVGSFAAIEHQLMIATANTVSALAGSTRTSAVDVVWLSWRLYQWLLAQALPDQQDLATIFQNVAIAGGKPRRLPLAEVLDPVRFGPGDFDHRLASVLHQLGLLLPQAVSNVLDDDSRAVLERLVVRNETSTEAGMKELPSSSSRLGWGDSPRSIPELAAVVLKTVDSLTDQ